MKLSYDLLVSMLDIAAPETVSLSAEIEKNKSKSENTDTKYLEFKEAALNGQLTKFKADNPNNFDKYKEMYENECK